MGVWYHPEYTSDLLAETARVANLDPRRGELILGKLMQAGLIAAKDVRRPEPATLHELERFHPLSYIEQTISTETLGHIFGLEAHFIPDADPLLRWARLQVGATMEAARIAVDHPGFMGINLGGGFHHAEPEQGSGFCVYNDVGVAISDVRARGYEGHIAIVDLDYHQGNGNSIAYVDDPTVLVYSLHGAVWSHLGDTEHEIHLKGTVNDRRYLAALRTTLKAKLRAFKPGLIFYIAGNDVLANDRLGDFWVSVHGVMQRDAYVIDAARQLGASLVVTLGGGYSPMAWQCSFHLARYMLTDARRIESTRQASVRTRFTQIARNIDTADLTADDEGFELTEADVFGDLAGSRPARKLLGFYSKHGVELAFERYGLLPAIRKRGFISLRCDMDPSDPSHQVVRIFGRRRSAPEEYLLVELVVRRIWIPSVVPSVERMEVLFIDWLLLQDPTRGFTLRRPPLPGQEHPGLGIAHQMQELLVQACVRLNLHGVFERPAHFHNLLAGSSDARFLDPEDEGRAQAMLTVLAGMPSAEASEAVAGGLLRLADGTPLVWEPDLHGIPVSRELTRHYESEAYRRQVQRTMAQYLEQGLHVASARKEAS